MVLVKDKDIFLNADNIKELSEEIRSNIATLLTNRCGHRVKSRMYSILRFDIEAVYKKVSWFDRIYIRDGEVHYNAGQSYPCEIKAIRNEIIRKFP